ncbi:DNA polymerase IV [Tissierella sp.]|uniref:DNA polymerase IV n=1 Tax=Tissierella sp. TaxID=41274 RepID=UPI00285FB79F|nr:DNA polymerase IV [Tissierella sp.]MDR7857232.1 DNA polymerase IV [Tissierella sp.]
MDIDKFNQDKELNIIHLDMDAFYASVEEQDNPTLKGLPVIVGGLSNHGIVTTANYEARKYGIHSAMPIFMAKKRCPKGCYIYPRMKRYQSVSQQIFDILYEFTDLVEKVSIDEAYLDISKTNIEPLKLVMKIKEKVALNTGLTMSIGISYNKFLAKLASEWNKPSGIKIITKDMVPDILLPLPVRKVHGIGPKSNNRLNGIGIYTVEDLLGLSEEFLMEMFGKSGVEIYSRIRGIDHRKVDTTRERKSLGVERTFDESTKDKYVLKKYLEKFSEELSTDLKNRGIQGRTIILKIKDENFTTQTRSKTLNEYINDFTQIFNISLELLEEIETNNKIRLIGITASNLMDSELEQLSLFD